MPVASWPFHQVQQVMVTLVPVSSVVAPLLVVAGALCILRLAVAHLRGGVTFASPPAVVRQPPAVLPRWSAVKEQPQLRVRSPSKLQILEQMAPVGDSFSPRALPGVVIVVRSSSAVVRRLVVVEVQSLSA